MMCGLWQMMLSMSFLALVVGKTAAHGTDYVDPMVLHWHEQPAGVGAHFLATVGPTNGCILNARASRQQFINFY